MTSPGPEEQQEAWKAFHDKYLAFKLDEPALDVSKCGEHMPTEREAL